MYPCVWLQMFLFYVAHGQLLRDHITQLKLRDGKSKQYEAFRDIYNQIKADLGIEYCELLTADGASDPARCLPLM